MNRAQNFAQRSWTESQQPVRRRPWLVTLLLLLLIVALAAFLWWILPKPEQRVFAVGFAVEESSERHLPRPAFARWDLTGVQSETWGPWLLSDIDRKPISVLDQPSEFCNRIENGPQLRDVLQGIQDQFREAQATSRDTLVVYVRGSSLVLPGKTPEAAPQLYLLAPEDTNPAQEAQGIPLEGFLGGLSQIKAANVLVLADIADLSVAPQFGLLENDVSSEVARIMQGLANREGASSSTPVWLILSRGSTQPNHVSYLLKKTLMQSAAEYALTSVSAVEKQRHLPLTDFYLALLRYAHDATSGMQTPLLFRSGMGTWIKDTNSVDWQDASSVNVALRSAERTLPERSLPANEPEKGTSANRLESPETGFRYSLWSPKPSVGRSYFVATSPVQSQDVPLLPDGTPEVNSAPTGGEAETAQPPILPETDLWLRFWQLRDALADRKNSTGTGAGWVPADFAVDRWQSLQREAIRNERLWRLSLSSKGSLLNPANLQTEITELNAQLEQASRSLHSTSRIGQGLRSLASDWSEVRAKLGAAENPQRAWLNPSLLAIDLQPRWVEQRDQLRRFMDVCCESAAWMELCLERAIYRSGPIAGQMTNAADQFRPRVYELIDQMKLFKQQAAGRTTVLDRAWNQNILKNVLSIHSTLRQDFDQVVAECARLLESESEQMTWQWERSVQALLSSPLLTYQQRKSLYRYYSDSESLVNRLRRPNHNNASVNTDLALGKLLPLAESQSLDGLAWKRKVIDLLEGSSGADQWLRACFKETWPLSMLVDQSQSPLGMMLPASGDTGLSVVSLPSGQAFRHQLPSPLTVVLRHRNGTSLSNCWMQWSQLPGSQLPGENRKYILEASLSDRSRPLQPGSPESISLSRDEFSIAFNLPQGQQIPLDGIPIQIRFARQESELATADPRTVVILPQNPDRIDLFVRRWDYSNDRLETKVVSAEEKGNDLWLKEIVRVPAVEGQAKSQYQFLLCNRSDADRVVRARLFGVESPLDTGNGAVTDEAILRTRREPLRNLQLIATVPSLQLPGFALSQLTARPGQLPGNERELNFPALDSGPVKQGRYGLLLVVDDAPSEGTLVAEVNGKSQFLWIDTISHSPCPLGKPDQWLVQISAQRREGSDVDFLMQVPEAVWSHWGLEKLRVEMLLTDERGMKITNRSASVAELSPQASDATLNVRPNFDSLVQSADATGQQPEKIIAHFHVGGYPRAAAFEYRVAGGVPAAAAQAFVWLDPNTDSADPTTEILLTRSGNQKLTVNKLDSRTFVIPNMIEVTDTSMGLPANAETLSVPYRVDFPKVARNYSASVRLGPLTPVDLRHDRHFDPVLDVADGRLVFSSFSQDHRYTIDGVFSNALLRGRLPMVLSINDTELQQRVHFIFDTEKPQKSKVELPQGSSMYEGESLRVEMTVSDEASEIKEVYFAINRERTNQQEIVYDDQDDMPLKADFTGGRWIALLKHDALAQAGILRSPGSALDIVARSVDWAGNVQDAHRPARFFWQGKKKTTPPKPSAK